MDLDAVVIGGGAAGLSGAVTLARQRRSVLVVDGGQPRNAPAGGVHAYLGRDGIAPGRLLADGREELRSYGGQVRDGRVVAAERTDGGFAVRLDDGTALTARRLLIATGVTDELPDVPGVRERWGRDVVHCPFCHGWEVRERPIAVLATSAFASHQALMFSQLSDDVVLLQHRETALPDLERLARRGVRLLQGEVERLVVEDDALTGVAVAGTVVPARAVVVFPRPVLRLDGLEGLGLEVAELEGVGRHVVTDATGATSVPGVFAAGNVTDLMAQVVHAAGAAVRAGAMLNLSLLQEDAA